MFIVKALNVTANDKLEENGLSDYDVWVGINDKPIWRGRVHNHVRSAGAVWLLRLRLIANYLEVHDKGAF